MATTKPATSFQKDHPGSVVEREMVTNIRLLVDTCFDEGDYEAGMENLDKARGPSAKPSHAHIRQLLYLALYPPSPHIPQTPGQSQLPAFDSPSRVTLTPRKGGETAEDREKRSLAPPADTSKRAINLLNLFAETNTPTTLLRGLPSHNKTYIPSQGWRIKVYNSRSALASDTINDQDFGVSEGDSMIAHAAMRFTQLSDVWGIFAPGFISRVEASNSAEDDILSIQETKGKGTGKKLAPVPLKARPTRTRRTRKDDGESSNDGMTGEPITNPTGQPIADYAWPVLDWLIRIFEKDEELTTQQGSARHSPLLLAQLPAAIPRDDISSPLDIIFYALSSSSNEFKTSPQQAQFRTNLGNRLMRLLINLTSPPPPHYLSPSDCLQSISTRFASALFGADGQAGSPFPSTQRLTASDFEQVLASFPPAQTSFKFALLCLLLASRSEGGDAKKFLPSTRTSTPTAAPAKPARKPLVKTASIPDGSNLFPASSIASTLGATHGGPFPAPAAEDILHLLVLPPKKSLVTKGPKQPPPSAVPRTSSLGPLDDIRASELSNEEGDVHKLHTRVVHSMLKLHILSCILVLGLVSKSDNDEGSSQQNQASANKKGSWKEVVQSRRLRSSVVKAFPVETVNPDGMDIDVINGLGVGESELELVKKAQVLRSVALTNLAILEKMAAM